MTCVELQESLVENENGSGAEQQAHLKNCPACTRLVADLLVIASSAFELQESDEPHPRVWKSIAASLKQEGLIRPQRKSLSLLPSLGSRWSWARWAAPVAALLLITLGIYFRQPAPTPQVVSNPVGTRVEPGPDPVLAGLSDEDLLQEVAQQSPALQAQYADNLRRVNQYIHDAKEMAAVDPNDEEARLSLIEAYQEKAMLFELALDRSLQ